MPSEASKPVLSVRGLAKSFSGKTVVSNVSFDIYLRDCRLGGRKRCRQIHHKEYDLWSTLAQ